MIIGIGTDLIDIARMARAIERPRFLERIYTKGERERIEARGANTAAGIFCAKEAVAKALGTGFRGFFTQDIEVDWDDVGKPAARLHGGARLRFDALGGKSVHLSISHAAGFAQAFCVIED